MAAGVTRFDKAQWQPGSAFRCMVGVALPVFGAIAIHHTPWGALAGLGALYAGFGSYHGVYRQRIRSIFLTILSATIMTLIGCLVSKSNTAAFIFVPLAAFVAALYATSSQLANSVATQAVCVLVVLSGLGLGPESALGNCALVAFGGIFQLILLTVIWPVNPRFPERKAVSDAFTTLADFFAQIPAGVEEFIPGTQRFEDARGVLQESREFRWRKEHEILVEMMRSAESLRASAVGFAQACEQLEETRCERARVLCDRLSVALHYVGAKILVGKFNELDRAAKGLPDDALDDPELAHWYGLLKERLGDLNHTAPHLLDDPFNVPQEGQGWRKGFSFLTKLPDTDSLRNVALSHAIRYTVTLEIALVISRLGHESHLYWLPLTVAIILRADFATTVTRGVARLTGTLIGVTIASLFLATVHPSGVVLSVLTVVVTWFCFALIQPNYALYSVAITLYVVFSVNSAGIGHHGLAFMRLLATLVGSGLSLAAYVLWPAFQGRELTAVIVEALDAQIQFGEHVKKTHEDAATADDARNHARQLRLRAESLFQTAALEPWGVSTRDLAHAREAILTLDANAAELLAARADESREIAEIDRVLLSSKTLRDRLAHAS